MQLKCASPMRMSGIFRFGLAESVTLTLDKKERTKPPKNMAQKNQNDELNLSNNVQKSQL